MKHNIVAQSKFFAIKNKFLFHFLKTSQAVKSFENLFNLNFHLDLSEIFRWKLNQR